MLRVLAPHAFEATRFAAQLHAAEESRVATGASRLLLSVQAFRTVLALPRPRIVTFRFGLFSTPLHFDGGVRSGLCRTAQ